MLCHIMWMQLLSIKLIHNGSGWFLLWLLFVDSSVSWNLDKLLNFYMKSNTLLFKPNFWWILANFRALSRSSTFWASKFSNCLAIPFLIYFCSSYCPYKGISGHPFVGVAPIYEVSTQVPLCLIELERGRPIINGAHEGQRFPSKVWNLVDETTENSKP